MKNHIKSTLVLVSICAVMAVLLALTNSITAPIIQKNQDAAANEALLQVMPNGTGFEKLEDLSAYTLPSTVTDVYKDCIKNAHLRVFRGRYLQARLYHKSEKSYGF